MAAITPFETGACLWAGLLAYWMIAALFVRKTRRSEPLLPRLQHLLPIYAGLVLVFSRPSWVLVHARLYDTTWQNAPALAGLAITAAGLALAVYARVHLGRYWSGLITLKHGHRLITTGPYRRVRHPIYTGWLLALLGTALAAGTATAFLGLALVAAAFVLRLRREEKLLAEEFGPEFARYKRQVPAALFPYMF